LLPRNGDADMRYLFEDFASTSSVESCCAVLWFRLSQKSSIYWPTSSRTTVISRDDLLRSVWDGRIVTEAAQTTCINGARRTRR